MVDDDIYPVVSSVGRLMAQAGFGQAHDDLVAGRITLDEYFASEEYRFASDFCGLMTELRLRRDGSYESADR